MGCDKRGLARRTRLPRMGSRHLGGGRPPMERRPYPGWRRLRHWEVRSLGDWEKTSKTAPNLQVSLSPSSESNPDLLGTDPGGST